MENKRAEIKQNKAAARDKVAFEAKVAEVMARIADDDADATWELRELAEPHLERLLRAEARRLQVRLDRDDLFGLVNECVLDLAELADSWKPNGALPWVWAYQRVRAHVHHHIGVFADSLDESMVDWDEPIAVAGIDDPLAVLVSAAESNAEARELLERLNAVATQRDAQIYLGIRLEQAAGNRSPAVTVGVDRDMKPEAVRKAFQRVGERLDAAA